MNTHTLPHPAPDAQAPYQWISGTCRIASRLGVSASLADSWMRRGRLPGAMRSGRSWGISEADLLRAIENGPAPDRRRRKRKPASALPWRPLGSPVCTDLEAFRAAAAMVAAKVCCNELAHVCFRQYELKVETFTERYGGPVEPSREDAERLWVRLFVPVLAEHYRTYTDLAELLEVDLFRIRDRMERLYAFLGSRHADRDRIRAIAETIVERHLGIIRALTPEIRHAVSRIDTEHPLLTGVPYRWGWA